jgi:hypothetical protein
MPVASPTSRRVAAALLALVVLPLAASAEKDPWSDYDKAIGTVTLSNGSADGRLSVEVDGYGSFGSSVESSAGALYNPVGALATGQTAFESAVFFGDMTDRASFTGEFRDFLTTDDFGADLPHIDVQLVSSTEAHSSFDISVDSSTSTKSHVDLVQQLETLESGSRLVQQYTIRNDLGQQGLLTLVRFLDSDLCFSGGNCDDPNTAEWQNDVAGASSDYQILYAFDSADSFTNPTTLVSTERSVSGAASSTYSIQPFRTEDESNLRMTDRIDAQNGIPATAQARIYKDVSPQDRLTDSPYDPTLSFQDTFVIPAGASIVYTVTTTWGQGSLTEIVPVIFKDGFESAGTGEWSATCNGVC